MEGSSRAAKKACVRRVPRARARARPVHVLLFIVFEGWQLRVGERREIERGVARMHEELEQRERERWWTQYPDFGVLTLLGVTYTAGWPILRYEYESR
eukprot:COSAG01_NODE_110_length_25904_cov_154.158806_13_plen_98_part_00